MHSNSCLLTIAQTKLIKCAKWSKNKRKKKPSLWYARILSGIENGNGIFSLETIIREMIVLGINITLIRLIKGAF